MLLVHVKNEFNGKTSRWRQEEIKAFAKYKFGKFHLEFQGKKKGYFLGVKSSNKNPC